MLKNLQDRRVQKTRQLLQSALIALIAEKGYEPVTVQNILDRANVGRSTFYAHFQDKEQLLQSCFDSVDALFVQHKKRLLASGDGVGQPGNFALGLFQFVGKNHLFFKALLGKHGNGIFKTTLYDYVLARSREHFGLLMPREKYGPLQPEIMTHYFVSAIMGVLVWWVEKDMPCSTEEIDRLLQQLAIPGIRNTLGLNLGS